MPQSPPTAASALTPEALLQACARSEHSALRQLYDQEAQQMLGLAHRILQDRALAEDALHEAFLRIWQHAQLFNPQLGSARGWMHTIIRHQAIQVLRQRRGLQSVDDETLVSLQDHHSLEAWHDQQEHFAWQGQAGAIERCLGHLEPVRRNCILYAYVEGLSQTEIAARVQAPLGTVKSWIKRSLAGLKDCLA